MDVKYLNYFITIAQERNMTKAAEKLYVAQSSLSYQLAKLEAEVGTQLFLRSKNDLILTPAGELYYDAARHVIALKNQLYQDIAHLDNRGIIRICVNSIWGNEMMADIIPQFMKALPDLTIEVSHTEDQSSVRNRLSNKNSDLDYALLSVPFSENLSENVEILREEEVLFAVPCNHPYLQKNSTNTIEQTDLTKTFNNETIFISKRVSANYQVMEQLFLQNTGSAPPKLHEINGIPLTINLVAKGEGVSFIPVSGIVMDERIHYYSCVPKLLRYNVLIHRINLVFNKPEQLFYDCVKNYYTNHKLFAEDVL